MKIVKFKSLPEFYKKEKNFTKTNTVREYEANDERFEILKETAGQYLKGHSKYGIEIVNSKTGESFQRFIQDVSIYKNLYIITLGQEM